MSEQNLKYRRIEAETKDKLVKRYIDLACALLGARIVSCSDEFFAEASNLLKPENPKREPGLYTEHGAWMDGWETRRHNPSYDWAIVKLGFAGRITGFAIDTSHFNGNQAPAAAVEACYSSEFDPLHGHETRWVEILPKVSLKASAEHYFEIPPTGEIYTHVRLSVFPDGGIARFRVYGIVNPIWPIDQTAPIDLAFVGNEGRAVDCSDQHYGVKDNLLLPGRGVNMGDGWETKRSREPNHCDWVVVKLGRPGYLESAEIDTAHFKGNFPQEATLDGCFSESEVPAVDASWVQILPRSKLGPDAQFKFVLSRNFTKFSHVRMTIFPDGGVKRLRIIGRRELPEVTGAAQVPAVISLINEKPLLPTAAIPRKIFAAPLTHNAYVAYGQLIQSFPEPSRQLPNSVSITNGLKVTPANQGSARKFNHVARVINFRQAAIVGANGKSIARAEPNMALYRCKPATKLPFEVRLLERHPYSSQAFIPMAGESVRGYLVIVCLNGIDDKPDLSTLKAFIATRTQGISYNPGVWHHPMISLEETTDFVCLVHESGVSLDDCEEIALSERDLITVEVPGYHGKDESVGEKRKAKKDSGESGKENTGLELTGNVRLKERHSEATAATTSVSIKRARIA